eukprot:c11638_g1_i1.p3 GENE.c11638_g1_i1~~c11638_g1_i1.p3  ORF type:complete len:170 (+),score=23.81 c11638_g1_i1:534-1043(+)
MAFRIPMVTLYDPRGWLKANKSLIIASALAARDSTFGLAAPAYTLVDHAVADAESGSSGSVIVHFADLSDGRRDIVNVSKSLAAQVQTGAMRVGDITEAAIGAALDGGRARAAPDFAIVLGSLYSTVGMLPWQLAATEIYHGGLPDRLDLREFVQCLCVYANTQQRNGM